MMTFSIKRVSAIVRKEYMDLMKNYQMAIMGIVPIILAVVYSKMNIMEPGALASMLIMMTLIMVPTTIQANMIAEEKEKDTLRGLMLSPANVAEVLTGKSFITIVYTAAVCVACLFIIEVQVNALFMALVILVGIISFICIGTFVGLMVNSVSVMNTILLPMMFALMFGAMFAGSVENEMAKMVLDNLITSQIIESSTLVVEGEGLDKIAHNLLVMGVWFAVSLVACIIVYRKKRFD
jgi:ABC-2 type transport system permease protein